MYRLLAEDVESEVYYSITGTDAFNVDSRTGVVKLARFLNKKVLTFQNFETELYSYVIKKFQIEPEIRFTVTCEDLPVNKASKNTVSKRVIVYVVDKINSNPPAFDPVSPTEVTVPKVIYMRLRSN